MTKGLKKFIFKILPWFLILVPILYTIIMVYIFYSKGILLDRIAYLTTITVCFLTFSIIKSIDF